MFSAQASLTMRLRWLRLLPISLLFTIAVAQTPNNPTRILRRDNLLYVFEPSSSTSSQFQLGTIDVSSPIDSARLPYTTLYPTLPFLDDTTPRAFTPLLDDSGNITVYTGDCSQGANGGHVWTFTPSSAKEKGIGSWKQEDVSVKDSTHNAVMGPNYLGGGMTFSSTVDGDAASTSAYIFGGMCPFSDANSTTWQSAANYSNLMTTLQPSGTRDNTTAYTLDLSTSRGPPVPEAGFSITGLEPTFSNRSDGSQTQQQNFLLIGGHTSTAFINMSQVALFSLPEQGWTFIGVEETDSSHTDLARRANAATIDPRSGHTAALTPDGQRIVVFGGWVGDTGTPAEPQLAILNIASGYGGKDDWHWTLPSSLGEGLPTDSGLYGHGATMLPGGVMMIRGGYTIPSPSSRRRATPTVNSKSYFFNVTSNTWVTDYSPPPEAPDDDPINTGPLSSPGQKVGLGVGLGMGLAAVCGLFAFYMWYTRRLRKQREVREKQIQNLSFTTRRYNLDDYSPNFDGRGGQSDAMDYLAGQNGNYYFPPGTQGGQGWKQTASQDAERTGLLVKIPSPTRGLRRSLSGRPGLVTGKMRGPGNIHPIDELEEDPDEEHTHDSTATEKRAEMSERGHIRRKSILDGAPVLDPFIDARQRGSEQKNGFHSAPTSPSHEGTDQSDHAPPNWPLGAIVPVRHSTGRLSPDKSTSERTGSNLSEQSTRSGLSWTSSSAGLARSASLRSAAILHSAANANPFKTPNGSPTRDRSEDEDDSGRHSPVDPRTQSFTSVRSNVQEDIDSFRTAQSSFAHLQAEGEALLGGNPERPRPGTSSSNSNTYRDTEGSNSRAATATPATSYALDMSSNSRPATRERRKSWLGSVRRVLTRSASGAERTRSTATMSYHERYTDHPISPIEPSTTDNRKSFPAAASPPRRAASDASFWRSRRGQQDWLEDELDTRWKRTAGDDWGTPEDIALAERDRQRREWRERGNLLVTDNDPLPTPRTPIRSDQLGVPPSDERPCTPASEADWDVEAAVERRVVQVMFTVPKSKLRVVNADVDHVSLMSLPRENSQEDIRETSPSRVKDLAGRFEQLSSSPRTSPRPSPSPSIQSLKIRGRKSEASLGGGSPLGKGKRRDDD
ncbi:hypothetical protein HBH98_228590 [Parastagonospora nodorum]|nr:hypothetical protein HBH51_222550 [Parastagonospora nodorum]KAH4181551.1 hypothetical protein HBH42_234290 [Parastagonospora nodorum]KAH4189486.1 hypothetical protein HBI95_222730 [Parastagonospora nodorum]KAH4251390.1 hypothetical protein HBI03_224230 [Parastagonospora nodorum]KAH4256332.1 hypothetical protein HBI04_230330 [Parastagonospora nodorum]